MLLAKAVLFLAVMVASEAVAVAQSRALSGGPGVEERLVGAEPAGGAETPDVQPTARLTMDTSPAWLREFALGGGIPRAASLFAPQTLPPGARFVTPRTPGTRVLRAINGRFVPIPGLQWHTRVSLDPRAMLAISPSLFIGRRPTFMPEGFRGGRTFGFAVHLRLSLDQPAAAAPSTVTGSRTSLLMSKVKALLPAR